MLSNIKIILEYLEAEKNPNCQPRPSESPVVSSQCLKGPVMGTVHSFTYTFVGFYDVEPSTEPNTGGVILDPKESGVSLDDNEKLGL